MTDPALPPDRSPPDQAPPDQAPQNGARSAPLFDRHMLEALVCPLTQATLTYAAERQELISRAAGLAFPIRNGIPIMIAAEARTLD